MNKKQKKEYLASGGEKCPVCDSTKVSPGPISPNGQQATAEVECLDCGHCWQETYTLTDVQAIA